MKVQDMRLLKRWVIVISVCAATPFVFINLPVKMQPVINDISTDLDNPPVWTTISKGPLPESSKASIRSYYKDLKPLIIPQQSTTKHGEGNATCSLSIRLIRIHRFYWLHIRVVQILAPVYAARILHTAPVIVQ